MRISLVSEHASPLAVLGGVDAGGQNVHVAALATRLAGLGHAVVVHTRRDDPDQPAVVPFADGVVVHHVDAGPAAPLPKDDLLPYMRAFARRLSEHWRAERPDVVHAHFWMSGLASLVAARPLGIPVVQTFHALGVVKQRHQGAADTSPPRRATLEPTLARTVDHVLATCSDEVFELRRLGTPGRRISVVPCGVDLSLFRPDGPVERRTTDRMRVVAVSRLVPRKGLGNLVSALAEAPDTELVIAGGPERDHLDEDPEVRRLRALAAEAGVADRVVFRGRVERRDLPALLRSADVVASVPWYEPFGIVPLEAMACGVPVLATAVGGLIDTVVHGRTGWHVPPRAPERIAEVLRHVAGHPEEVGRCGRAAAARAAGSYGWDRVARNTAEVYGRVLAAHAQGRTTAGPRERGVTP